MNLNHRDYFPNLTNNTKHQFSTPHLPAAQTTKASAFTFSFSSKMNDIQ